MRRNNIVDPHVWSCVVRAISSCSDLSPKDFSLSLFSLSCAVQKDYAVLPTNIKAELSSTLQRLASDSSFINRASLVDMAQILYGISILFPKSPVITPFIAKSTALLNGLPRSPDEVPILQSCREICLLWSVARLRKDIRNRSSRDLNEALLSASRGLRNCSDFNQNKAAQIADTLRTLQLADPRIMFQVIHYLDKHGHTMNGNNLMRMVKCLGELKIDNPIAWRRIANRIESPVGVGLSISDLELLSRYVVKFAPAGVAQRASGIISLYIKTKSDAAMYGDSL